MATIRESFDIARKHHRAGELRQAQRVYLQILDVSPNNAEALHELGLLTFQSGDRRASIDLISRAIAIRPESVRWHINLGEVLKQQGHLDQAVASFQRALQLEPNFAEVHCYLGSVLNEQRHLDQAVACYERALQIKPEYADAYYNLGNTLKEQGMFDQAVTCYERALQIKPENADAHYNLGNTLKEQGKLDQAVASYQRALQVNPEYAAAHNNLGNALRNLGQLDEATTCFERALQIEPGDPAAHINLGNVLGDQRRLEDSLASYQRAFEIDPHNPGRYNRAMAWLSLGNFEQGWPEYEWRWKTASIEKPQLTQPMWNGEPLNQRTIVLWTEQGFGDVFQFVRYASLVKEHGGTVLLHCDERLAPILSGCPGVDGIATQLRIPYDAHAPLMSLPYLLRTTLDTIPTQIPYLFPAKDLVQRWQRELGPSSAFRIGIAWHPGNPVNGPRDRSIPLVEFTPLAQLPGVELFSLQQGRGVAQLATAGFNVSVFDEHFDTVSGAFMDSAAVIANLDLVISLDSALCHLAGAMGAPVWVAVPCLSEWRWMMDRDDSPWYPTMRLFRQRSVGDWAGVFQEIATALQHHLSGNRQMPVRAIPGQASQVS